LIAALVCWQIAVIFGFLYRKLGRRQTDLVFALLTAVLSLLAFSEFLLNNARTEPVGHWSHRLEYVWAFLSFPLFLHFVALFIQRPLPQRTLRLIYGAGIAACGVCLIPGTHFLERPLTGTFAEYVSPRVPYALSPGPLYPFFVTALIGVCGWAWWQLGRGPGNAGRGTFVPLQSHGPLVRFATLGVLATSAVDLALVVGRVDMPFLFFPLGLLGLAVSLALALGREVMRAELEKRRLAELSHLKDEAVRHVAHELTNPLAAILATARMLLKPHGSLDEAIQREFLQGIETTARRAARIIHHLLDRARLEAGRPLELRLRPVDLPKLVEELVAEQQAVTEKHTFQVDSPPSLEAVVADEDKLAHILSNLLSNAVKYSPEGGSIGVRVVERAEDFTVSVSDEGLGLTPEQAARVFEPYERAVDPRLSIPGTGLGLPLVRAMVQAHGGKIRVESQPGVGSVFSFTLPKTIQGLQK
jgi:signal transduction histidine kinase